MCCGPPGGWFSTSGRREECPHSGPNLAQLWLLGWSVSLWVSASSVGYAVIEIREGQFGTEDAWRLAWVPISQLCDFWRVTVPPGGWWLTFVETEQVMMNPFLCSCAFDLCCSVVPLVADGSWGEGKKQVRTCRATVQDQAELAAGSVCTVSETVLEGCRERVEVPRVGLSLLHLAGSLGPFFCP